MFKMTMISKYRGPYDTSRGGWGNRLLIYVPEHIYIRTLFSKYFSSCFKVVLRLFILSCFLLLFLFIPYILHATLWILLTIINIIK